MSTIEKNELAIGETELEKVSGGQITSGIIISITECCGVPMTRDNYYLEYDVTGHVCCYCNKCGGKVGAVIPGPATAEYVMPLYPNKPR